MISVAVAGLGVALAWALSHHLQSSLISAARDAVFSDLRDGLFVLDAAGPDRRAEPYRRADRPAPGERGRRQAGRRGVRRGASGLPGDRQRRQHDRPVRAGRRSGRAGLRGPDRAARGRARRAARAGRRAAQHHGVPPRPDAAPRDVPGRGQRRPGLLARLRGDAPAGRQARDPGARRLVHRLHAGRGRRDPARRRGVHRRREGRACRGAAALPAQPGLGPQQRGPGDADRAADPDAGHPAGVRRRDRPGRRASARSCDGSTFGPR